MFQAQRDLREGKLKSYIKIIHGPSPNNLNFGDQTLLDKSNQSYRSKFIFKKKLIELLDGLENEKSSWIE